MTLLGAAATPAHSTHVWHLLEATAFVLLALVGVFVAELQQVTPDDGALTGLTERLVAGAQSLWPLVVTVALRRRRRPV